MKPTPVNLWLSFEIYRLSLAVAWAVLLVTFYKVGTYYGVFG